MNIEEFLRELSKLIGSFRCSLSDLEVNGQIVNNVNNLLKAFYEQNKKQEEVKQENI